MPVRTAKKYEGYIQHRINPFIRRFIKKVESCNSEHYTACIGNWEGYAHHNLLYRERQIYSLMAAAMHEITPVHQSESPVIRRRDRRNPRYRGLEREANGRVDLWAHERGIDYYFEFKRSYVGLDYFRNGQTPVRISRSWDNLVGQVGQVRRGLEGEENTCCVGLHVITPYKRSSSKNALRNQRQITKDEVVNFFESFRQEPDTVLWYRSDENSRIIPIEWEHDNETKWVLHPCHLFLFKILFA